MDGDLCVGEVGDPASRPHVECAASGHAAHDESGAAEPLAVAVNGDGRWRRHPSELGEPEALELTHE